MPAPHHSVFLQAGCLSCRPTNSVKALKAKSTEGKEMMQQRNLITSLSLENFSMFCQVMQKH